MITSRSQKEKPINHLRREGQQPDDSGQGTEVSIDNVIVIGASAGGHQALRVVLEALPKDIPAAIIIMQHMAAEPSPSPDSFDLKKWLSKSTQLPSMFIRSDQRIEPGMIYVVPGGMSATLTGRRLELSPIPPRPAPVNTINRLFESAAHEFGDRVIGVVLTGFLKDGTRGLKAIHDAGGLSIVQDPASAEYPEMPANAMQDLPVTFCLRLADIGPTLDLLARRKTELETGLAVSVRTLKERVAMLVGLMTQSTANIATHEFLSAELNKLKIYLGSIEALVDKVMPPARKNIKKSQGRSACKIGE
jgi:chemotaxis response regulator CheB